MPSDEELMLAVGRGDLTAFEELMARHHRSAWRTACRFLGDSVEAEDIAQEAFLRILNAAPRYRPVARFQAYLYRIVARLCLDAASKNHPAYVDDPAPPADPAPSPAHAAANRERDEAIRQAIKCLTARQRMAVALRYYEGLRCRDIAAAMATSPKAVERLLARARTALEAQLRGLLSEDWPL